MTTTVCKNCKKKLSTIEIMAKNTLCEKCRKLKINLLKNSVEV
jgi:hypothetical protein